ncbi:acetylneuraminic acid synthetase [Bacillus thuringiensis]|uniref:N-acetylneuraminate synthase family protein n=1 Tax=Bacillus cereus group TaxID=86661 RepID=UPI000A3C50D7|nr:MULTISPECIES: N-acetylneuraminate synthase family protein [Bacillus cereus group]OUA63804.1 acetylneuraminic acid synthetase [Bacillus thuringiensis serovar thailandensis]PKF98747.1 acetylneuraminic acid synthetase [Bacillus cereus]HDR7524095.1 N-acetylneuraminate synthase family protein [Bacillus paranthracis]MDA1591849.1 N-acetylneuraminate synthase family protein [Bacillus cereus group sp. TH225LC]PFN85113.1 acetylneuraminic acid synthetase [Bacillus thuringiensis]
MKLVINEKEILREGKDVYLIAEAGVNHGGNLELAKKMIKDAAEAGADAIKFQTYKAEKLASKNSPAYWDRSKEKSSSQYELFKKYDAFWVEEYKELAQYCKECGIDFMSTPFDSESAEFLNELMPAFKIASADLTNHPFLKQIAAYGKPVILSTGASTLAEICEAVEVIENEGNNQISLLHCVLSYPTKDVDAHLNMITHLKEVFPNYVIGYSDHTVPDAAMMTLNTSVFLGAKIIEKHYTYDKTLEGNDHYHAMDANDIKVFKNNLKIYNDVLGEKTKKPTEAEKQAIKYARRSLVATGDIEEGTVITREMLTWKRPGTGISPKYLETIIGLKVTKNIKEDDVITWEML